MICLSSHGAVHGAAYVRRRGRQQGGLGNVCADFALELGDRGINVNIIRAGLVETDSTRKMPFSDIMFAGRRQRSMTGDRFLTAEDVADTVLFLASPLSDLVQGETLTVDGGTAVHA